MVGLIILSSTLHLSLCLYLGMIGIVIVVGMVIVGVIPMVGYDSFTLWSISFRARHGLVISLGVSGAYIHCCSFVVSYSIPRSCVSSGLT